MALDHLRRRDLYDALGLARDAPPGRDRREGRLRAAAMDAEDAGHGREDGLARGRLARPVAPGLARVRGPATTGPSRWRPRNGSASRSPSPSRGCAKLDYGTRAALIDEAGRRGIAPERADVLITRGCRTLGVARDGVPALILNNSIEPPRYLRCRACSGVTEFAEVSSPPARPECRHCRGLAPVVLPVLQAGPMGGRAPMRLRISARAPRAADPPLRGRPGRPTGLASTRPRSTTSSGSSSTPRTTSGPARGSRRSAATWPRPRPRRLACESARARRQLVAARAAILTWARLVPDDSPEFVAARDEVARGLRMAQSLAAKGRAIETDDPKAARRLYEKALGIAADLDDAREGLRRCPPDPLEPVAEFDVDRVRLRWTPPPPDGLGPLKFRVVRKRQGIPAQPNDGAVVAEVARFAQRRKLPIRPAGLVPPVKIQPLDG